MKQNRKYYLVGLQNQEPIIHLILLLLLLRLGGFLSPENTPVNSENIAAANQHVLKQ